MKGAMMILLLVLPWARAGAQLSLEACQEKARANYPLAREHALIERAMAFDLINANRGYLPRLSVSARATYQSGVTRLPVNLPGIDIKELSRDQYQAAVEVTQVLWDGGEIAARKRAVETAAATRRHQVEVDLHALRERVNQLFFGVLLADEQLKQNRLLQEESRRALEQVEALAGQGIASASDVDAARVMQVQARQREAEIRAARDAYREMLGLLAGEEVGELEKPVARAAGNIAAGVNRPELALFQARREQHTTRLDLSRARNRPRASLFVQGGYGRPGLNMLSNDFSAYSVGGIRLSWSLDNLYTYRNERRLVAASREEEDVREEAFLLNLSLEAARERGEVERWRALLVQDDEIVTLLERVAASAGRQVQEGTASVLEWTREVNRLDQARQARALHEMQWLLAIYTSLQITGE